MSTRNIVLTGLSGCGKTALGRLAAERLGAPFADMDELLEKQAGIPVREIFQRHGEPYFRDLEAKLVKEIAPGNGKVIATGGGVVLREENMRAFRENGLVIFLDRPPDNIAKDIDCANRPLLAGGTGALFRMAEERRPLYLAYADIILPCAASLEEALDALTAVMRGEWPGSGFAVIGDPIAHTLSPVIHRTVFGALGVGEPYDAIHVPKGRLGDFVEKARASGLKGFNVTIPHKKDILPFLDEVEEEAALCGAVNTVVVRGQKLYGYNTDMQGLLASLQAKGSEIRVKGKSTLATNIGPGPLQTKDAGFQVKDKSTLAANMEPGPVQTEGAGFQIKDKSTLAANMEPGPVQTEGAGFRDRNVVILGTGGAAGAIALKAAREGARLVTVLGRRARKAEEISENIKRALNINIQTGVLDAETTAKAASAADILINATPLGMSGYGEDFESLEFLKRMPSGALVCDIVYNPPRTQLLGEAALRGLKTQNGLSMLIYQALLADELFLNRELDKPALYGIVSVALLSKLKEEAKK